MNNTKLTVGEKYLSIKLAGHDYVAAFKNKDKQKSKEPDFRGDGVAVWISEKKAGKDSVKTEDLI